MVSIFTKHFIILYVYNVIQELNRFHPEPYQSATFALRKSSVIIQATLPPKSNTKNQIYLTWHIIGKFHYDILTNSSNMEKSSHLTPRLQTMFYL